MLELEVGIWSFEGCVSFLGFPRPANPLAPKTENPPRRQSDHAVMPCARQAIIYGVAYFHLGTPGRNGFGTPSEFLPKPPRHRS